MTKIIIDEDKGTIEVDIKDKAEDFDDSQFCGVLLATYVNTAKELMRDHHCDNPDCCFKQFNQEIIDAINTTSELHALEHRHAK